MTPDFSEQLIALEPRLRSLLTADLYARTWVNPDATTLMRTFEHLRTLQASLQDYVSREVSNARSQPGILWHRWLRGTLLFTDLAGFTTLVEASASQGNAAAEQLLSLVNDYFSSMIEVISKSGGNLLEFTGDAMLVQFPEDQKGLGMTRAVHTGLRMQRVMATFATPGTYQQLPALKMRIGIHTGQFVAANVGTPLRMEHVLLGRDVQLAKLAEGNGAIDRVCLTDSVAVQLRDRFTVEPWQSGYQLLGDQLEDDQLGEYDLAPMRRRMASPILFDRSPLGILTEIQAAVNLIEPLACYLPRPVLRLLVNHTAQRQIPPKLVQAAVIFVNLQGLPEAVDRSPGADVFPVIQQFSTAFALMNAAVESRGGVLQKVTYYAVGSNVLIHFGVLNTDSNLVNRAVTTAIAVRDLINQLEPPEADPTLPPLICRMGITTGTVFAAEIGEPRGRREFNILGDPVNTAARIVNQAKANQILLDASTCQQLALDQVSLRSLGLVSLKGKAQPTELFDVTAPSAI